MIEGFGKRIHCVGIGGIGLSGLARFLHANGHTVSGSDMTEGPIVAMLRKEGITVATGVHTKTTLPADAQTVIATVAALKNNVELREAERRGIPVLTYSEALALYMKGRDLVAVSGAHGKSTTTALIGWALEQLGADPSVLVGSLVAKWNGNIRIGRSSVAVVEADEYARNFLHYRHHTAVITNLDYDHVDTYSGFEDVLAAFLEFIGHTAPDGNVILPAGEHYTEALRTAAEKRTVVTFGLAQGDVTRANTKLKLRIPGRHNQYNGLAALAALRALGYGAQESAKALWTFPGLWRRFEELGTFKDARVFSDYAHHPREVRAVLETARELFPRKRLLVVFQPHHAARMKYFRNDFARELKAADVLFLTEIYHVAGREEGLSGVAAEQLMQTIRSIGGNVEGVFSLEALAPVLTTRIARNDVVLFLGAGSIDAFARAFVRGSV